MYQIRVDYNSLSGVIPNSIGKMRSLYYLYGSNTRISGTVPTEIGKLTSAYTLSLEETSSPSTLKVCVRTSHPSLPPPVTTPRGPVRTA